MLVMSDIVLAGSRDGLVSSEADTLTFLDRGLVDLRDDRELRST
jgi:hypothetical protein